MGESFIVRKGLTTIVSDETTSNTLTPSINFVSNTPESISFTITNNDSLTADIFWEIGDSTPDENSLQLQTGETSTNIVVTGLEAETSYTIFAFANAEGKAGSQTSSKVQTTQQIPVVYTQASGGAELEYELNGKRYRSHTFTSNGNFIVNIVGDPVFEYNKVDYLVISGGGGGGRVQGGGGGAGGYRTTLGETAGNVSPNTKYQISQQTYPIHIGGGGAGGLDTSTGGSNGGISNVFEFNPSGGGGGATRTGGGNGKVGGSGGGGASDNNTLPGAGVLGEGNSGSQGSPLGSIRRGGGGGGAGSPGQPISSSSAGSGGNGLSNLLRTGLNETRAGGGGGSTSSSGVAGGQGGLGGGGRGDNQQGFTATSGQSTTGSGGGADAYSNTIVGTGGSGIVIIRYEIELV